MTRNNFLQVLSAFHWLNFQNLEADWVTVTDDDCFMNVQNVFNSFNNTKVDENYKKMFCGLRHHVDGHAVREQWDPWFE